MMYLKHFLVKNLFDLVWINSGFTEVMSVVGKHENANCYSVTIIKYDNMKLKIWNGFETKTLGIAYT